MPIYIYITEEQKVQLNVVYFGLKTEN
jgi:hypothetical protein